MPSADVLCIGETMGVVSPRTAGSLFDPTVALGLSIGGAESNVALALAALGVSSRWWGRVGDDPFGRSIVRALTDAGVATEGVVLDPERQTGVYFKDPGAHGTSVHYYRAHSAATAMRRADLTAIVDAPAIVHVSGITAAVSDGARDLLEAILLDRVFGESATSFDVNYRAAQWPSSTAAPVLARLAESADIVFVGLDEAQELWNARTPGQVRACLPGPKTLVVKDGAVGATCFVGDEVGFEPAPVVEVVEQIGAGDAFAAGFLAGVVTEHSARDALRLGHLMARHVLLHTQDSVRSADVQGVWETLHEGRAA